MKGYLFVCLFVIHVYVCAPSWVFAGASWRQRSRSPDLEFQEFVINHPTWVLGTKARASPRTLYALNCRAMPLAPEFSLAEVVVCSPLFCSLRWGTGRSAEEQCGSRRSQALRLYKLPCPAETALLPGVCKRWALLGLYFRYRKREFHSGP